MDNYTFAHALEPQLVPLSSVTDNDLKSRLTDAMNLMDNTVRGLVAEVMVAKAMSGQLTPPWDPWDIDLPSGEKVEVKATGLYQAWAQIQPSTPVWRISEAGAWVNAGEKYLWDESRIRRSSFYVFCLHKGIDPGNPEEWEFRPVATRILNKAFKSQASVRLSSLDFRVNPPVLSFEELQQWDSHGPT